MRGNPAYATEFKKKKKSIPARTVHGQDIFSQKILQEFTSSEYMRVCFTITPLTDKLPAPQRLSFMNKDHGETVCRAHKNVSAMWHHDDMQTKCLDYTMPQGTDNIF